MFRQRSKRRSQCARCNTIESQEIRLVLSSVTVAIVDEELLVQGSPMDDDVRLRMAGNNLQLLHRSKDSEGNWSPYKTYNAGSPDQLTRIRFSGGAGDDRFQGDETVVKNLMVPMELNGGAGQDDLHGAAGPDILRGGGDRDSLFGQGGNDRLYGGTGTDALWGGHGGDFLDAGSANETVYGGGANADLMEKDFNAWRPVIGGASLHDIYQNQDQNCAFLATLSALADTQSVDFAAGIQYLGLDRYNVTLAGISGGPVQVRFNGIRLNDDPLPNPAVHPGGEFWTILYWRAFKQSHRSLIDVLANSKGNPASAYKALTGNIPFEYNRRFGQWDDAADQKRIRLALSQNRAIVAGTRSEVKVKVNGKETEKILIYALHSYSVIGFTPSTSTKEAIVKLRNPWGHNGDGNRNFKGEFTVTWSQFRSSVGKYFVEK